MHLHLGHAMDVLALLGSEAGAAAGEELEELVVAGVLDDGALLTEVGELPVGGVAAAHQLHLLLEHVGAQPPQQRHQDLLVGAEGRRGVVVQGAGGRAGAGQLGLGLLG